MSAIILFLFSKNKSCTWAMYFYKSLSGDSKVARRCSTPLSHPAANVWAPVRCNLLTTVGARKKATGVFLLLFLLLLAAANGPSDKSVLCTSTRSPFVVIVKSSTTCSLELSIDKAKFENSDISGISIVSATLVTSQTRVVPSVLLETRVRPLEANSTCVTAPLNRFQKVKIQETSSHKQSKDRTENFRNFYPWPEREPIWSPVSADHKRTVLSRPLDATIFPSGAKHTDFSFPPTMLAHFDLPVSTWKSRIVLSSLADARALPLGEKQTAVTQSLHLFDKWAYLNEIHWFK